MPGVTDTARAACYDARVKHKQRLIELIVSAQRDVSQAEGDLEKAIGDIQTQARADKMTISAVVDGAFGKLRAARQVLSDLEKLVDEEPG